MRHVIDAPNSDIEAGEAANHAELTNLYPTVQKEEPGPWQKEDERQKAIREESLTAIASIRPLGPVIGLLIAVPFVLSSIVYQLLSAIVMTLDKSSAMAIVFGGIFIGGIYVGLIIIALRKVSQVFRAHSLKSLFVVLPALASLYFISLPLSPFISQHLDGVAGYAVYLGALALTSAVISTLLIFIWTLKRIPYPLKLAGLLAIVVLSYYLSLALVA